MPTLIRSSYNPARGGHAPGDVRDAFEQAVAAYIGWDGRGPEPQVELRDQVVSISTVFGLLWDCTDVLPGNIVAELADADVELPSRSTYAAAARQLKIACRS